MFKRWWKPGPGGQATWTAGPGYLDRGAGLPGPRGRGAGPRGRAPGPRGRAPGPGPGPGTSAIPTSKFSTSQNRRKFIIWFLGHWIYYPPHWNSHPLSPPPPPLTHPPAGQAAASQPASQANSQPARQPAASIDDSRQPDSSKVFYWSNRLFHTHDTRSAETSWNPNQPTHRDTGDFRENACPYLVKHEQCL